MGSASAAVLGLFEHAESVADARDALRAAGFPPDDLTVLSSVPYPNGAFGEEVEAHRLHVYPLAGAVVGLVLGLVIAVGTQIAYPLVTGGKPILAIPPSIVIMTLTSLLGATALTFFGVLFESRLPRLSDAPYDPRISEGLIGLLVRHPAERADQVRALLGRFGAVDTVARGGGG